MKHTSKVHCPSLKRQWQWTSLMLQLSHLNTNSYPYVVFLAGKVLLDEVMIYHLIHSPTNRGQIGQFTIEEFWKSDCRIRINNTTNGMSLYGNSQPISRTDVLKNAFTVSYLQFIMTCDNSSTAEIEIGTALEQKCANAKCSPMRSSKVSIFH